MEKNDVIILAQDSTLVCKKKINGALSYFVSFKGRFMNV